MFFQSPGIVVFSVVSPWPGSDWMNRVFPFICIESPHKLCRRSPLRPRPIHYLLVQGTSVSWRTKIFLSSCLSHLFALSLQLILQGCLPGFCSTSGFRRPSWPCFVFGLSGLFIFPTDFRYRVFFFFFAFSSFLFPPPTYVTLSFAFFPSTFSWVPVMQPSLGPLPPPLSRQA